MNEKIKSLREAVGQEYKKPDPSKILLYKNQLWENEDALKYLYDERGLNSDTIKHFQLGYNSEYDAIAIPIFKDGELINFKYRLLNPDKAKYLGEKGAESWLYNEEGLLFGLNKKAVLVVEGEFDLMSAWQAGIKNVVSPSSGKDSYGIWISKLDDVPKVYIAYDNDEAGKEASKKIAERLGVEKCFEVVYPEGYKDANDYFKENTTQDFAKLVKGANPYYSYDFKGLGDVIHELRTQEHAFVNLSLIPKVEIEKDWLIVVSGKSNVGKTSYALNVANELASNDIPTLIMPFERGISSVGKRFLQVRYDKTLHDFLEQGDDEWNKIIGDCVDLPIYFALPERNEIEETIIKSRRLFDTRFVIIDHLDYVIRNTSTNRESEIANTLQSLKRVAEEYGIVIVIITHPRKVEHNAKITMEDLKGSSSLYQDPECVIILNNEGEEFGINVSVEKNKGEMADKNFDFNFSTGKFVEHPVW